MVFPRGPRAGSRVVSQRSPRRRAENLPRTADPSITVLHPCCGGAQLFSAGARRTVSGDECQERTSRVRCRRCLAAAALSLKMTGENVNALFQSRAKRGLGLLVLRLRRGSGFRVSSRQVAAALPCERPGPSPATRHKLTDVPEVCRERAPDFSAYSWLEPYTQTQPLTSST